MRAGIGQCSSANGKGADVPQSAAMIRMCRAAGGVGVGVGGGGKQGPYCDTLLITHEQIPRTTVGCMFSRGIVHRVTVKNVT